jgi:hypothetical protein
MPVHGQVGVAGGWADRWWTAGTTNMQAGRQAAAGRAGTQTGTEEVEVSHLKLLGVGGDISCKSCQQRGFHFLEAVLAVPVPLQRAVRERGGSDGSGVGGSEAQLGDCQHLRCLGRVV